MKRARIGLVIPALILAGPVGLPAWATERHVPGEYPTIQAAIDVAVPGDEVVVADGIYTGVGNKDLDFGGKAITVRSASGDPAACIIDCEGSGRGFYFHTGEGAASILQGLTISNGNMDAGGGVYCDNSSPTLTHCKITGSRAWGNGGGVFCANSSAMLTNSTIAGNTAWDDGGGLYCIDSSPTLTNCTIVWNHAWDNGGAGLFCVNSSPTLTNCAITGNTAWEGGGGGGVFCEYDSNPTLINCKITGNSACGGGGLYCWNGPRPTLTNCAISGNAATNGGGVYCSYSNPTLTNCTISGNTAADGGGGVYCSSSSPTLTNCILWDNTPQAIYVYTGSPIVTHCDVQGGWSGTGNINSDPLFVDPDGPDNDPNTWEDNNYRFSPTSPCIDSGDNTPVTAPTDLDGNPRVRDGDQDGTATVDMGAYEFQGIIYVDDSATGANDGSTWCDAYNYLQDAMAAVAGGVATEIRIAQGTYKPDQGGGHTPGDREASFRLRDGLQIRGGYAGCGAPDPNARDVALYETVLSGDVNGDDVEVPEPADLWGEPTRADNSYNVVVGTGTTGSARLEGCTVTAGCANDWPDHSYGGGMYIESGSPTVTDCRFLWNYAGCGAGMHLLAASPTITRCSFIRNACKAVSIMNGSDPWLANCRFVRNEGDDEGGGVFVGGFTALTSPTLVSCQFTGNTSQRGGAMYVGGASLTIINCVFTRNVASLCVAAICVSGSSSVIDVTNCILWDGGDEISNASGSTIAVTHSDVEGGYAGTGNIDAAPLFVDVDGPDGVPGNEDDNLRLSAGSPCIDVGDNSVATGSTDPDGNPRIVNGVVDMGAYEFAPPLPIVEGDAWLYFKGTEEPPADWKDIFFDDTTWLPGATPIGYEAATGYEGCIATHLPDMKNSYMSIYARRAFHIDNPAQLTSLGFTMDWDDGYIAYLNGVQVDAQFAPDPPDHDQPATTGDHEACCGTSPPTGPCPPVEVDLSGFIGQLVAGTNVLAVQVHNRSLSSSDFLMLPELRSTAVIYVDAAAVGSEFDGTTWCTALRTLDEALAIATRGTTIQVADGIYTPNPAGLTDPRDATFELVNGVTVEGGYAGCGAPDPDAHDVDSYETILSGDLNGNDGPGFAHNDENAYHVIRATLVGPSTRLDGFTIRGGNADGVFSTSGGGLYLDTADATIRNCIVAENWADVDGGGLFYFAGDFTLERCTFKDNAAGQRGGGVASTCSSSAPLVMDCKFFGNTALLGGGWLNGESSNTLMINCLFNGNHAASGGATNYYDDSSYLSAINCTFTNNTASSLFGGVYMEVGNFANCVLWGNSDSTGSGEGAQIECFGQCTYSYNCIQGWTGNLGGVGNIGDDPLFIDADGPDNDPNTWEDNNYRLSPTSPCIDSGDNTPVTASTDLDGNPRVRDGDQDGTATVDMGAYEFQGIIYVDDSATGANDGSTWCDAYNYLQDAMAAAAGGVATEIRIAQGTYKPDQGGGQTPGDRQAVFQLLSGVAIKGGYAGCGQSDPDARDIALYETVLSGDLNGDDLEADFPWGPTLSDNCYGVARADSAHSVLLDGIVISAGNAYSWEGGGISLLQSDAALLDCRLVNNVAGNGGALYIDSNVVLTACLIEHNAATNGGAACISGGVVSLYDCTFGDNYSWDDVGALIVASEATLANCWFIDNYGQNVGALCHGQGNCVLNDCIFVGNRADYVAGAIFSSGGSITLTGCTLVGNVTGDDGAGGLRNYVGAAMVTNCIFWDNRNAVGADEASQITITGGQVGVSYSAIAGLDLFASQPGNIGLEPLFEDPGYWDDNGTPDVSDDVFVVGDYHLQPGSPCIDAGNNGAVPPDTLDLDGDGDTAERMPFDLDGLPRFVDEPGTGDTGLPDLPDYPAVVDMGAYEFQSACDHNGIVNVTLHVEGLGVHNPPVTRTVTFITTDCVTSHQETIAVDVTFTANPVTIVLPGIDTTADWIQAREGHTLSTLLPLQFGVDCSATVSFTGDNHLCSGDFSNPPWVLQDDLVDIVDFAILAIYWNDPVDPNLGSLADATGDGLQGTGDFTVIQINFGQISDPPSGCGAFGQQPNQMVPEVAVEPLAVRMPVAALGNPGATAADLDGDEWIGPEDIRRFAARHRLVLRPAFQARLARLEALFPVDEEEPVPAVGLE